MTTALADFPLRGTDEKATPASVPAAVPSTNTHAKVAQAVAVVGS